MKFASAQNFTSLSELLKLYGDADEIVFKNRCELDEQRIAELCREARRAVHHLRLHHGSKTAAEMAQFFGVPVVSDDWRVAEGKLVFLAECSKRPPRIRLNRGVIDSIAELMPHWANENELVWFRAGVITEIAIAHELYHLLEPQDASIEVELKAHSFAREFAKLPFSPLLYHELLERLGGTSRK